MLHHETDIIRWNGGKLSYSDPEVDDLNPTEIGFGMKQLQGTELKAAAGYTFKCVYMAGDCRRK